MIILIADHYINNITIEDKHVNYGYKLNQRFIIMDNQMSNSNNKAMNHIAVSVPDLDKAVKWYHEVLGFNILTKQKATLITLI